MAVELATGQAAALIGVSPNTLRAWERRWGVGVPGRTDGGHRRYRRSQVLALREALREGLTGRAMAQRADELERSGRYWTPTVVGRLERLEEGQRAIRELLGEALVLLHRLDNAGIVRRDGNPVAGRRGD